MAKTPKIKVTSVTPFLWFDDDAIDAAKFYVTLMQGSRVVSTNPMGCEFELAGQRFMALNGGPHYKLTPAFSIFVKVKNQQEFDALWDRLTKDGGKEQPCGWLVDKFGVSWQIMPQRLLDLIGHKNKAIAQAAVGAMMKMKRIDIAQLDAAVAAAKPKKAARGVAAARS